MEKLVEQITVQAIAGLMCHFRLQERYRWKCLGNRRN